MANISSSQGQHVFLNRYHIFGRDTIISSTHLLDSTCSKLHAIMYFDHDKWYIQDQSINGTIVNDTVLSKNKSNSKSAM